MSLLHLADFSHHVKETNKKEAQVTMPIAESTGMDVSYRKDTCKIAEVSQRLF